MSMCVSDRLFGSRWQFAMGQDSRSRLAVSVACTIFVMILGAGATYASGEKTRFHLGVEADRKSHTLSPQAKCHSRIWIASNVTLDGGIGGVEVWA